MVMVLLLWQVRLIANVKLHFFFFFLSVFLISHIEFWLCEVLVSVIYWGRNPLIFLGAKWKR